MNQPLDGIRAPVARPRWRGLRVPRALLAPLRRSWPWLLCGLGLLVAGVSLASDASTLVGLRNVLPAGHYLILLQNNAELRPSGGFIGSFATVDLTSTGYRNLQIDTNIYKRDNSFTEHTTVVPPEPLIPMTGGKWAMRDSNWDPDFATAAAQVAWFYQQEGGEPVDGVIAVNATVIQDLLELTGPVQLPDLSEALSAETFFDTLHYQIEKGYFLDEANLRTNEPKLILADLLNALKGRLIQPRILVQLGPLIESELGEKHLLLYHTDPEIERRIVSRNWGGTIQTEIPHSLTLVNANLTGKKSSLNMRQDVELTVETRGAVDRHHLTVQRTHTGTGVWPDFRNNNYLRALVPLEASLIGVRRESEEVTEHAALSIEAGHTSVGLWVNTDPQTSSSVTIVYDVAHLPSYRLVYQKQPGVVAEHVRVVYNQDVLIDRVITTDVTIESTR